MSGNITALDGLLGLIFTSAVLIAVPGPSIMFLVGQAMTTGRRSAMRGVIGNAIGTYCVAVIVALGIGTLLMRADNVLTGIRLLGAVVLLAIGVQYLFSRPLPAAEVRAPGKRKQTLIAGVIVGITNPKALIMFGTIVPSFLRRGVESPVESLLFFSLVPIGLGLLIDSAWVATAHAVSSRAFFNEKGLKLINIAGGGLMIAMAVLLAMETLR
ncbi:MULTISPECIES: LysE family translocator [Burkholderia]|uniref:LysE family translocator n=1 Tax=Burkholderia TaxID=32008 RepID=UPI000327F113|nr:MULTISPECIES: LysE family translocator [Burkholderia]AGK50416.1 lysE type translocator family protein [Burkholderia thailandensis MSMB121]ATF32739.1 LysE family translocator [Burkholderia thailandensis]KST71078.1 lysine transporter LysE [Burkholderia humptydooensis]KVM99742.1 lysine transporter LysE [Burkholderia sp. MSMB1552]KWZ50923.1 lysine transporter LysE [Burkholderia sp. MSMB1588]